MSDLSPECIVPANGQTYKVVPPRKKDKDAFVGWLKANAIQELVAAKPLLPVEDYQSQLRELIVAGSAGAFAWDNVVAELARKGRDGKVKLLSLILPRNHAVTKEGDGDPFEAIYDGAPELFDEALAKVLGPSPNSHSPQTAGTAQP